MTVGGFAKEICKCTASTCGTTLISIAVGVSHVKDGGAREKERGCGADVA